MLAVVYWFVEMRAAGCCCCVLRWSVRCAFVSSCLFLAFALWFVVVQFVVGGWRIYDYLFLRRFGIFKVDITN